MSSGVYRGDSSVIPMAAITLVLKQKADTGKWGVLIKISSGDKILAYDFDTEAEADRKLRELGEDLCEFYNSRK